MHRLSNILILVFLAFLVVGADMVSEQVVRLNNFSGLDTRSGDFAVKPNACRIAQNIDWSKHLGSITRRDGYDSVSAISGQDSAIGLYSVYQSNGEQYLVFITDSTGVGYGNIYASPMGQADLIGTVMYQGAINAHTGYIYRDTIVIEGNTTWVAAAIVWPPYTDAASPIADSINNNPALSPYITASVIYADRTSYLKITQDMEGITWSVATDTAQNLACNTLKSAKIYSPWSIQAKPSFATFNDMVYIANGRQKGLVYNGDKIMQWPANAPGECTAIPLDDAGLLHGEYRYILTYNRHDTGSSSRKFLSFVSSPVIVDSGQIMLKDFQWVSTDITDTLADSLILHVYRTRANPSPITDADYAFYTGVEIIALSDSDLATKTATDSTADADLTTDSICLVDYTYVGLDSTGSYSRRYGAPGYISQIDSVYDTAGDTLNNYGIYYGIPEQVDTLGVVYAVSFIDTITGTQSALGPQLAVETDSAMPYSIQVAIPNIPAGADGLIRNLYRAHILQVTYDTLFDSIVPGTLASILRDRNKIGGGQWGKYTKLLVDTVITGEFRLLAQIEQDSAAYTDSIRYDSLHTRDMYSTRIPTTRLKNLFTFDGRLFGIDGSQLYASKLDSGGAWGAMDFISLNKDDGDEITLAYASRGVIRVFKNYSSYNVFQDANLEWNRREINNNIGCIASYSHAISPLGHYYLSSYGVVRETDGSYLERTVNAQLVSQTLKNFDIKGIDEKSQAVGFYHDNKYLLTIGDTTYVYDELADAWSTWSLPIAAAVHYNTEEEVAFLPGDTMYFIKPGESNLYRYGTSSSDNGSIYNMRWRSVPLLGDQIERKQLTKAALCFNSDNDSDNFLLSFYDERGRQLAGIYCPPGVSAFSSSITFDSLTHRYAIKSIHPNLYNNGIFYQADIRSSSYYSAPNTKISNIDIYWRPLGPLMLE